MGNEEYSVYSEFDLEKHKVTFKNYLEVIIHEDGSIHYAIPSHQEYMIKYACKKLGCNRDYLYNLCPEEYYLDFMTWLCMTTNCIAVYNMGYFAYKVSNKQRESLKLLKENNLLTNLTNFRFTEGS